MITAEEKIELNGHELVFRSARKEEAEILLKGMFKICEESPYLASSAEDFSDEVSAEEAYIEAINRSLKIEMVCAFLDGQYIGNASLNRKPQKKLYHRAELGIALFKEYSNMGIGNLLMQKIIRDAQVMGLKQIELEVYKENEIAIHLYEKYGFIKTGTIPRGSKDNDIYSDFWIMVKFLDNEKER